MLKKILKNEYVYALFSKGITIVTGILSNVLLTRYLGVELKGGYSYINTVIGLLMVLLNFGIYQTYMHQRKVKGVSVLQKYINIFIYQFSLYCVLAIIGILIVNDIKMTLALIALPFEVLNHQIMMVFLVEDYIKRQRTIILSQLLYLSMTALMFVAFPRNLVIPILLIVIKDLICIIISFRSMYNFKGDHKLDFSFLKSTLVGGFLMMLAVFMLTLNYKVDILMLEKFSNDQQIGLYSVGVGFAEYLWIIPDAFKEVLFGKAARGNAARDVKRSIFLNLTILLPLIVIVYVFAKKIIHLLYGSEFVDAYSVTQILLFGIPVMMMFKIIGTIYIAAGKYLFYTISLAISAIINLILNWILIPQYAINGAAIASVFSYNICGLIFLIKYIYDNKKEKQL